MKKSGSRYRTSLAVCISTLLLAVSAEAGTLTVTTSADSGGSCPGTDCTLRQAIATATSGSTIVFQIPIGDSGYDPATGYWTITLFGQTAATKELLINKDLTIDGSAQKIVVRRANNAPADFRIFNIAGSRSLTVMLIRIWISNGNVTAFPGPSTDSHGWGGGILNVGNLTLRECIMTGNASNDAGGAIFSFGGVLTVIRSTFSGNLGYFGGAIATSGGGSIIDSSTFTANAAAQGGAISVGSNGTIQSCTIYGNSASRAVAVNQNPNGGGGLEVARLSTRVQNTIIANNTSAGLGPDVAGSVISDGHNLIGESTGHTGFGATDDQIGVPVASVNLDLLQDNGGPTTTMLPRKDSLAIDKGKRSTDANGQPNSIDQRGYVRPVERPESNAPSGDGSDIGAVELGAPQTSPTFTVTTTLEHLGECTTDECTLLEALNVTNAVPDANTINFRPGLTGVIGTSVITPSGLAISNPVTINGPGARVLTISGNNVSRLFNIASAAGTVSISGLTLSSGRAAGGTFLGNSGGAVLNAASLTLTDCTVSGNFANLHGGAIYNNGQNGNASLTVVNCTLSQNVAEASGGAIFSAAYTGTAKVDLTNCTLDLNYAKQYGGAIYNDGTSNGNASVTLTNCTLNRNDAGSVAGGIYNDALNPGTTGIATVTLRNTILKAGTLANLVNDSAGGGAITSQGNNISSDNGGGFLNQSTDRFNTNPGLDILKNNGGPTDTVALLSNSVARDTGNDNAPQTDQRGYFRNGVSDIGAFEFNGVAPLPPTVAIGTATNVTSTSATLNTSVNPNGLSTTFQFVSDFASFAVQDAGNGTANVPFSVNITGLTPNTQYHFNAIATSIGGTTQGVEQTFTTLAVPTTLANVSTRLPVGLGDDALIVGFIITGTQDKKVIIRAIGPSLGRADQLGNPTLELFTGQTSLGTNDDWMNSSPADQQAIIDSTIPPSNSLESAIVRTLPANGTAYTAVVRGVDNSTGIGVVEVYDLDRTVDSKLANVSTRGFVQTGDNVLFAGMIVLGSGTQNVIIRAIGPSLSIAGKLLDPTLELVNGNGTQVAFNDNWRTGGQEAEIIASTVPPTNDSESAIVATLSGNGSGYTAIVRGVDDSIGIALVEVYALP